MRKGYDTEYSGQRQAIIELTFNKNIAPERILKCVRTGACLRPCLGTSPSMTCRSKFLEASTTALMYGSFSLRISTTFDETRAGGVCPLFAGVPPLLAVEASSDVAHSSSTACKDRELTYVPEYYQRNAYISIYGGSYECTRILS